MVHLHHSSEDLAVGDSCVAVQLLEGDLPIGHTKQQVIGIETESEKHFARTRRYL